MFKNLAKMISQYIFKRPVHYASRTPLWNTGATDRDDYDANQVVAAIYTCVKLVSETIRLQKMMVVNKDNQDILSMPRNIQVKNIAHLLNNPTSDGGKYTADQFWDLMIRSVVMTGNAYAVIEYTTIDGVRYPAFLRYAYPENVSVIFEGNTKVYRVTFTDDWSNVNFLRTYIEVAPHDIIHFRAFNFDGLISESPIEAAARAVDMNYAAWIAQKKILENRIGSNATVISPTGLETMTEERREEQLKSWAEQYSGIYNAGKTPWLPHGADIKYGGISSTDLEILNSLRLSTLEIASVFSVPAQFLAVVEKEIGQKTDLDYLFNFFKMRAIMPYNHMICRELEAKLFTQRQRMDGFRVMFQNTLGVMTSTDRVELARLYPLGVATINEVRRLLELSKSNAHHSDDLHEGMPMGTGERSQPRKENSRRGQMREDDDDEDME